MGKAVIVIVDFLVKFFVKDSSNINNICVRGSYGILVSVIGIVSNLFLFLVKLFIGILLQSVAVTTDAFNNLSDMGSSLVTLIGFKLGAKPPDKKHPFGHGRIEYVAALMVSFIILLLGYESLKNSVSKIMQPEKIHFSLISIIVLLVTILVKLILAHFNSVIGKRIHSAALIASAKDAFNDCIVTAAAILSIVVTHLTGVIVDGYAGVIVSIFVLYAGVTIARDMLSTLLGEPVDERLVHNIEDMVLSYKGIIGIHDLIVHNYGPSHYMATIHVEVPHDVDIEKSHEIIDRAEREIEEELGVSIVMHMDPINIHDERIMRLTSIVAETLSGIESSLNAHDFRIIEKENGILAIFDLSVPYAYTSEQKDSVCKKIQKRIFAENAYWHCVINLENPKS